jgi:hypothetical protein
MFANLGTQKPLLFLGKLISFFIDRQSICWLNNENGF